MGGKQGRLESERGQVSVSKNTLHFFLYIENYMHTQLHLVFELYEQTVNRLTPRERDFSIIN